MSINRRLNFVCSACVFSVFSVSALASGFQLLEQNASGLGNAYAGSGAIAEDASTVFYNPGAMSRLKGGNISGGIAVIRPSYKFKDDGSSNTPAPTGSNGGDAGALAALPNAYATWQLGERWFAGLGMGAPFGLKTEYSDDWAGRFQSQTFDIKTYNLNPSLAYQLSPKISIGLGLNYQKMEARYVRSAAVVNALTQSTQLTLDADSDALGWNAGALFALSETMDIGFSYRSKMFHRLEGTLSSTSQLVSPDVSAAANITLPDTYALSIAQRISERWTMLGDISRTNWSSIDQVAINRTSGAQAGQTAQVLEAKFRDTWRVALGGKYMLSNALFWKYGVAYDQSPVRGSEERLLSLPDNNRYWFSTGLNWKADETTSLDIGAAYIYIPDSKVDADQSSKGRGHVVGQYRGSIFILGAQLSKRF